MVLEWPQLTLLALYLLDLGFYLSLHGRPRRGEYNVCVFLVSAGLTLWLLYKGGFFT